MAAEAVAFTIINFEESKYDILILGYTKCDKAYEKHTNIINPILPIYKINENSVIKTVNFTHPYLNSMNTALQKDLRLIQGKKRTWFCGSYFGYGFHEDGLKSSIDLINNFKI